MKTIELEEKNRRLKEAEDTLKVIKSQASEVEIKIKQLKIEIYILQNGLTIGDNVKWQERKKDVTGQITGWTYQYNKVSPIVSLHKKDGSVGLRTKDYWGYTQPTKI